jgi:hypothetical protein
MSAFIRDYQFNGRTKNRGDLARPLAGAFCSWSASIWRDLERRAKQKGMKLHALLREVIAEWLRKAA